MEKICEICKNRLLDDDEIISCPDCGREYHRKCWKTTGCCADAECQEKAKEKTAEAEQNKKEEILKTNKIEEKPMQCTKCGMDLLAGQKFCPKCGNKIQVMEHRTCVNCNSVIGANMKFCPNCGSTGDNNKFYVQQKKKLLPFYKKPIFIIGAILIVVLLILLVSGGGGKEKNGENSPKLSETEKSAVALTEIYEEYCSGTWATIAADGSCLTIDTNPYDKDDYIDYEAYMAILSVNKELALPEALGQRMQSTSALDGRQEYDTEKYTISWKYHPDKGLEVIYEINRNQ